MRLIVAGSRDVTDYELVEREIDRLVREGLVISAIIEGAARGADALASRYAQERGIENIRVRPEWKRFGRGAGPMRNRQMAAMGDALLALWDGKSTGTKNMIAEAEKHGIQVFVVRVPRKALQEEPASCEGTNA